MGPEAGVKALVDGGLDSVPSQFVRPLQERASVKMADTRTSQHLPVIDLSKLDGPDRAATYDQIHRACKEWGFFQVINHGVPRDVIDRARAMADQFHRLPVEEKLAFKPKPDVHAAAGIFFSSLGTYCEEEATMDWRDVLMHKFEPGWEKDPGAWPEQPLSPYKETVLDYLRGVQGLAYKLLAIVSENLGIPVDYFERELAFEKLLTWNFYPTCPEPDLTLGVKSHADWGSITVLLPGAVPGLQVKKDGEWIPVEPKGPDAFVINLGDTMQAISNGLYTSADHRATVNADKDRLSIALFMQPIPKQIISPAPQLVSVERPAHYRPYAFEEFTNVVSKLPELPDANFILDTFRLIAVG